MNILEKRDQNHEDILKRRYTKKVLTGVSKDIDDAQRSLMKNRGFENQDWYNNRGFVIDETSLEYSHMKKHRFVDMKVRKTKDGGSVRKKSHPIHNRIIWGHYNQIIKELHFGFTDAVKAQMNTLED